MTTQSCVERRCLDRETVTADEAELERLRMRVLNHVYENHDPYPLGKGRAYARTLWKLKQQDLHQVVFKADLLQALGVHAHPRADRMFEIAWRDGHQMGLCEVIRIANELADLLR